MEGQGFEHEAFFYADAAEFVHGASEFVRGGLADDEAVLVLVAPPKIAALRDALGRDADGVTFADMGVVGENPARLIPAWQEFMAQFGPDRPARGIGEPVHAGLSRAQLGEVQLHEELLNLAFAGERTMKLLCPYDAALPSPVLDEARRSHPYCCDHTGRIGARREPRRTVPYRSPVLDEPPQVDVVMDYDRSTLSELRDELRSCGRAAGLDDDRLAALLVAASEIANNSIEHGGGHGHLRLWADAGALVCELHDNGWIADPLVGRVRPPIDQPNGRGMWLANQLCNLVEVRSDADQGTTVRLHVQRG